MTQSDFLSTFDSPTDKSYYTLDTLLSLRFKNLLGTERQNVSFPEFLDSSISTSKLNECLALGITCLNLFIQSAYTGPHIPFDTWNLLPEKQRDEDTKGRVITSLSVDGEEVYRLLPHPYLLYLAKRLLQVANSNIWRLRVDFAHQRVLDDFVPSLQMSILEKITEIDRDIDSYDDLQITVRWELEKSCIYAFYQKNVEAQRCLDKATNLLDFSYELTGRLGKRTKFQINETSQLVVHASGSPEKTSSSSSAPKEIELEDDTLLSKIAFTQPEKEDQLNDLQKCILLGQTQLIKNTNPADGLTIEEVAPFAERVLTHSGNWSIYTMALILRSRCEAHRSRTAERSVLQLQALVDSLVPFGSFLPPTQDDEVFPRLQFLSYLLMPSSWELQKELATRYANLGAVTSAMEIFERLEMREEQALCYAAMGREDKAIKVLKSELLRKQTPKLWCLLGDLEQEPDHWRKSWEISHNQYARAQRSLAKYELAQSNLEAAKEAYEKSLKAAPLHSPTWYSLGCLHLSLKEFKAAAESFTRVVSIDSEDSEAWSNLASALLKLGKTPDAFRALNNAVSKKWDSWRMWENYLYISMDIKDYNEALRSLKRILELKKGETGIDVEVLDILVSIAIEEDHDSFLFRYATKFVIEQVQPVITNDDRLWRIVGKIYLAKNKFAEALDAQVKAYRCCISRLDVAGDQVAWENAVAISKSLIDSYRELGEKEGRMGGLVCKDWMYKSKTTLRSLKGRGKHKFEDTKGWADVVELLQSLEV
ncbi:TPR repeat-containing protein [Neolecta irregularis DAH-3]|uniref:TPR repeat-containing protein n=1 Tax=Neolecta irregularis (strain DAH-3) TaxID=1198029 RepID=A0A1U7LQQ9_NEOID|nr:TPR repeat-containing protein [Neolecta irregularis DAH-3]|eukprot:OLL24995.1 TPR repeat-containing protein [Neolecta irregularis DAH-3]